MKTYRLYLESTENTGLILDMYPKSESEAISMALDYTITSGESISVVEFDEDMEATNFSKIKSM